MNTVYAFSPTDDRYWVAGRCSEDVCSYAAGRLKRFWEEEPSEFDVEEHARWRNDVIEAAMCQIAIAVDVLGTLEATKAECGQAVTEQGV